LGNWYALAGLETNVALRKKCAWALFLLLLLPASFYGQCTGPNSCVSGVPHFVKINGALKAKGGASNIVPVKFVIYDAAKGGTAVWEEVQNVQPGADGSYEVMLGATSPEGVPMDLFSTGSPRWLGVEVLRPGSEEEARVLMVSVPYAMEAADAQTLGGLPPSAFAKSESTTSAPASTIVTEPSIVNSPAVIAPSASALSTTTSSSTGDITGRTGPVNVIPKYSGGGFANSQITDAGGSVTLQNLANILFADQFSGGVSAAVSACPANGCIIYAVSPNVNLNLGTIDPGSKAVTIYLGPYTYTVKQITLRKSLKIIGMGASGGATGSVTCTVSAPCNGTILQSTNGNNPVFVVPQINNSPSSNVNLSGFRVLGSSGNTSEDGILIDTSTTTNSGLWYSTINDVYLEGFAGVSVHVKGPSSNFGSLAQWVLFNNVVAYRAPGGGNALRLEGGTFELRFRNCEFDGQAPGDGTDIYLGGTGGGVNGYPISIVFEGLIAQSAATGIQLDGAYNVSFYNSHHEKLWGGYHITNNTGIGVHGLTITDSYFSGDSAVNGGAGYELKIDTAIAEGIVFSHNVMGGNPDVVVSSTNLASVAYQDNLYLGTLTNPPTAGITTQINPATSINVHGVHSVGLNPSTTPITTIQSILGPGEEITFYTLGGAVTFGSGGNIDLMGATSVNVTGSITFVLSDLGGPSWKVVSQWTPPSPPPTTPTPGVAPRSERRSNGPSGTSTNGFSGKRSLPN
jgi:hypothetical protein